VTPSHFSRDIREFLFLLHRRGVRYLLVGGEAVIRHGYPRLTGDIDIFFESTDRNTDLLWKVLSEFWDGDVPGLKHEKEIRRKGMVIQFGVPPNRMDLMGRIDGVKFGPAWGRKITEKMTIAGNVVPVYYIGLEDLIRNKRAVDRDRDRDDLRFLLKCRESKKRRPS
jgi:hypothetical protein